MAGPRAIIAASRMRGVGDNGACCSANHAAGNRCTGGSAGQASDQGTAARSDQRTAKHAILPCSLATGEHQGITAISRR